MLRHKSCHQVTLRCPIELIDTAITSQTMSFLPLSAAHYCMQRPGEQRQWRQHRRCVVIRGALLAIRLSREAKEARAQEVERRFRYYFVGPSHPQKEIAPQKQNSQ